METHFILNPLLIFSPCPHSLGTLIEWKLDYRSAAVKTDPRCPHSLGTLIEWKLNWIYSDPGTALIVPTRWGH